VSSSGGPISNDSGNLVPPVVRELLSSDEEVEVRYVVKGAEAYATIKRLIILRDGQTSSHQYDHIAGVREISRSNAWVILAGVAMFALGGTSAIFPVAGAGLILLGVLTRARRVELLVNGVKEPVVIDGAREVLVPLAERLHQRGARKLGA
jgi:hypothetical protein